MLSTLKSILKVSLIGLILIFPMVEVSHAHYHRAYYHDRTVMTRNPRWMTSLKDNVLLSQLSIPGTHDTMARYGGPNGECQTLTLPDQLESGIRVLDIRCRHIGNAFAIHHGVFYQHANFDDVLTMTLAFLDRNPGETVLMRVKEEYNPTNNTRTFQDTFRLRYWEDKRYKDHMWQRSAPFNPTLGEMRGKIVILQDFDRDNQKYGMPFTSFALQDKYDLGSNHQLYDKWVLVRNHLAAADTGSTDTKYMNFLSAAGKPFPFPYFVASGHSSPGTRAPRLATGRTTPGWRHSWPDFPRVTCTPVFFWTVCTIAFEGTNVLTSDRLGNYKTRVGTIMADFPGPLLIEQIIAFNNKFRN